MGPSLRKELGEQLVAAGLVGAAMTLFDELELWDALILCYRLLQKNVQAEELVHRRLKVSMGPPPFMLPHANIETLHKGKAGWKEAYWVRVLGPALSQGLKLQPRAFCQQTSRSQSAG